MRFKRLSLVLMLGAMFVFTGCGKGNDEAKESGSTAALSGEITQDVQKIIDKGVLTVGTKTDVPKFGYKDPASNEVEGFEVDLAKSIAKKIFGDEDKIETVAVNAKTRGPLLDNGEIDLVIATFTITDERKASYNFSEPYFEDAIGLLVKKSFGYESLADLDGKKIGVAQSSTTKNSLLEEAEKLDISLEFNEYGSYPEIKAALDAGRIDCFSVDGAILNGYLDDNTEILNDKYNPQEYGVASKKSNTGLAELVNEVILEMKENGELAALIEKWGIK